MKFLIDESVELKVADFLKTSGHNIEIISRDYPNALADQEVLNIAQTKKRILVTNDRDFGELIFKEKLPHSGVIYFKLGLAASAEDKIKWLKTILASYKDQLKQFIVVRKSGIKVHDTKDL